MAVSGAAPRKGQQESKCHHSFMESCDIAQYLVESVRQIIGTATVGFKRSIAQKTALNFPHWYPSCLSLILPKSQQSIQFNITFIGGSIVTDITNDNYSRRNNVSVELVLLNGQIL